MKEAAAKMAEKATAAGANIARTDMEILMAEARGTRSPRTVLRHLHLARRRRRDPKHGLPHAPVGPARVWLSELPENSIFCWFDLKVVFEPDFKGTYKRASTASDLQACIQNKSKTSREYLGRWLKTRSGCENIDDTTSMLAFIGGLQRGGLFRHKLTCEYNDRKLDLNKMISIASIHTTADDDTGGELPAIALPLHQQKKNNSNNKRKNVNIFGNIVNIFGGKQRDGQR
ncbi:hypothetical protein QYE76_064837 [Lolium multiflorum]|uniref:Retrotransposon gag domain-containing protein n=1 Tax=Lolium multiflorum TaxID=4521 RepID=A0AAD8S7R2_LOLMU|nr:hypothetical protein QYE76_064837 [Lolium multiflorum]